MSDLTFDVASLRRSGDGLVEAADDLASRTRAVLTECGDLTALGTYDTLGSVAQALYGAVLERVQDTVDSLVDSAGDHGAALANAAELYAATEDANVHAASSFSSDRF